MAQQPSLEGFPLTQNGGHNPHLQLPSGGVSAAVPLAPGFQALMAACHRLYPNQKNPLQISTMVKFWLGGPDPLDYISMYSNQGEGDDGLHWHYISCGLSDLHGDGRVHPPAVSPDGPSGYGFELTFRLKREPGQSAPPTWPAKILQKIARYVFETENKLVSGDHITWAQSLGGGSSKLQHLLVAEDVELPVISTGLGRVQFLQLVGVCEEELKAVQRWNGPGVIKLLRQNAHCGGGLLLTDINRACSLFDLQPETRTLVEAGIAAEGSNLCGMAACISWVETDVTASRERELSGESALCNWESLAAQCDRLIHSGLSSTRVSHPRSVALACSLESARYLPLCIQGRLRHGFHFTLKSILKETAVTFVVARVAGSLVTPEKPFAAQGDWLQVLIKETFLDEFFCSISHLDEKNLALPHTFRWPDQRLSLTVYADTADLP